MKCALCKEKKCYEGKDCTQIKEEVEKACRQELKSMRVSAHIEAEHYMKKNRLEELILYAKEMGYKRLGLAFCIGLEDEAETIHKILSNHFDVFSVCCKVCGIEKSEFDLDYLQDGAEATCNPVGQAMVLNRVKTDLNVILGLCIGHDILFSKYSEAPVTTLVVKDRVLAHNPLGAIYSEYYRKRLE